MLTNHEFGGPHVRARLMFDRRVNALATCTAFLINASFSDGLTAAIHVNSEFGSTAAAQVEAGLHGLASLCPYRHHSFPGGKHVQFWL